MPETASRLGEYRLLLEELCCDLCRFEHVTRDGLAPEAVRIDLRVLARVAGGVRGYQSGALRTIAGTSSK